MRRVAGGTWHGCSCTHSQGLLTRGNQGQESPLGCAWLPVIQVPLVGTLTFPLPSTLALNPLAVPSEGLASLPSWVRWFPCGLGARHLLCERSVHGAPPMGRSSREPRGTPAQPLLPAEPWGCPPGSAASWSARVSCR